MKTCFRLILLAFAFVGLSCKKNTPQHLGGSWNFESVTYYTFKSDTGVCHGSCPIKNFYVVDKANLSSANSIQFNFWGAVPTTDRTFTVAGGINPADSSQVSIMVSSGNGEFYYNSTGGNGREVVTATIVDGILYLSGRDIMMSSDHSNDSAALNFNINAIQ